jgi:hypothetical protein
MQCAHYGILRSQVDIGQDSCREDPNKNKNGQTAIDMYFIDGSVVRSLFVDKMEKGLYGGQCDRVRSNGRHFTQDINRALRVSSALVPV